jgi:hypothetical protein
MLTKFWEHAILTSKNSEVSILQPVLLILWTSFVAYPYYTTQFPTGRFAILWLQSVVPRSAELRRSTSKRYNNLAILYLMYHHCGRLEPPRSSPWRKGFVWLRCQMHVRLPTITDTRIRLRSWRSSNINCTKIAAPEICFSNTVAEKGGAWSVLNRGASGDAHVAIRQPQFDFHCCQFN